MVSVTRAVEPITRSALVADTLGLRNLVLSGLNRASARADTPKNTVICSQSPAPRAV